MDPVTLPSIVSNASITDPSLQLPESNESPFKVYVRCRPLNPKENNCDNPKKRLNIIRKHENMVFFSNIHINIILLGFCHGPRYRDK